MDAQNGFRSDAAQPALVDSVALSPKRERFAQEYLASLNASEAARRAGYSEHTAKQQGSRLLSDADVQMRVQQLQEERAARTLITQDRVLLELWDTYLEARKLKHLAAANQSLQLIGRHLSMFTDRVDARLTQMQIVQYATEEGLDPDELLAEVKLLQQRLR